MSIAIALSSIIVIVLSIITVSLVYWTLKLGISPTPTSPKVIKKLRRLWPELVSGEIHELGSGWGNLLPVLRNQYPHHLIIAHERSPVPRFCSIMLSYILKTRAIISNTDLFSSDLSKASLVICYLYPEAMSILSKQFKTILPKQCWIISHTFRLPGWTPVKTLQAGDLYRTPIYLYKSG